MNPLKNRNDKLRLEKSALGTLLIMGAIGVGTAFADSQHHGSSALTASHHHHKRSHLPA